jgi:hypothetical protein
MYAHSPVDTNPPSSSKVPLPPSPLSFLIEVIVIAIRTREIVPTGSNCPAYLPFFLPSSLPFLPSFLHF